MMAAPLIHTITSTIFPVQLLITLKNEYAVEKKNAVETVAWPDGKLQVESVVRAWSGLAIAKVFLRITKDMIETIIETI
jgi:hypothetical protein